MMDLPPDALALVRTLGVSPASHVRTVTLVQHGSMRGEPGHRFRPFRATETIATTEPAFAWHAQMDPFGMIRVTDRLAERQASLSAKAFGLVPIMRSPGGPDALKAQLMRYLAELPWAPDAMALNRHLAWSRVDDRSLRVAAAIGPVEAEVVFERDGEGRIASVSAADRPRLEHGGFVARPWHGRFWDYRSREGRQIPIRAEVGWRLDGGYFTAWQGTLAGWSVSA